MEIDLLLMAFDGQRAPSFTTVLFSGGKTSLKHV